MTILTRYVSYVQERFFNKKEFLWSDDENGKKLTDELSPGEFMDASHPFTFQLRDNSKNDTIFTVQDKASCKNTILLFNEMYPDESFFLWDKMAFPEQGTEDTNTKLGGFDVVESCKRQYTFLWQVS